MTSFTRWKIDFSQDEKNMILSKIGQISRVGSCSFESATSLIGAIGTWTVPASDTNVEKISQIVVNLIPSFLSGISDRGDDWPQVSRAIITCLDIDLDRSIKSQLVDAVQRKLLKHGIDRSSRMMLFEPLGRVLGQDHDLVLALCE
jgi:hypothetical protein